MGSLWSSSFEAEKKKESAQSFISLCVQAAVDLFPSAHYMQEKRKLFFKGLKFSCAQRKQVSGLVQGQSHKDAGSHVC